MLERRDRALAVRVLTLVLERCLDIRPPPARRVLGDLPDRHLLVALRRLRDARVRSLRGLLLHLRLLDHRRLLLLLGLRLGLRLRRGGGLLRARADRLDLDLRQARPETGVTAVAGAPAVLADPDLVAELMAHDAGGDGRRRRDLRLAAPAGEQHLRVEGLALIGFQAVDEQPLALLDAVLLAADGDDRVAHKRGKRGPERPARRGL